MEIPLMERAFDLTETRILLRRMVSSGYVTIEQLNTPSPHWQENSKRFRLHYPKYQQHEYRNPLRDPAEGEVVEVTSPRDFTPVTGSTPANAPPLPLTLDQPELPPFDADSLDF
jgi:hypothetical protein